MDGAGRIHKNWSLELVKDLIGLDIDSLNTIAKLKNADILNKKAKELPMLHKRETASIKDTRGLLDLEEDEMKQVMEALSKIKDKCGRPLIQVSVTANFSKGENRIELLSQLSWKQFVQLRAIFDKWKKGLLNKEDKSVVMETPSEHFNALHVKKSKAAGVLKGVGQNILNALNSKKSYPDHYPKDLKLKDFFGDLAENKSHEEILNVYQAILDNIHMKNLSTAKEYFETFPEIMNNMDLYDHKEFAQNLANIDEDRLRRLFGLNDEKDRLQFLNVLYELPEDVYIIPIEEEGLDVLSG